MNKIKIGLVSAGALLTGLFSTMSAHAAALSTTTLGTAIDSVSSTWYDYFLVFIANAWPFILGGSVLIGLVVLAIRFARRIFHG